jgi:hypothetical protein
MPFLRPLNKTAPNADRDLKWPIHRLAYVAAFMGPLSAGPIIGALARDWPAAVIGLLMGIGITFLSASLSDRFLDPWISKFQRPLQKGMPQVLANIAAFAWAMGNRVHRTFNACANLDFGQVGFHADSLTAYRIVSAEK